MLACNPINKIAWWFYDYWKIIVNRCGGLRHFEIIYDAILIHIFEGETEFPAMSKLFKRYLGKDFSNFTICNIVLLKYLYPQLYILKLLHLSMKFSPSYMESNIPEKTRSVPCLLVCDLNRTPIIMAKHGGFCVHFSGISTCGRILPETVSHPQRQPLPTPCKISLAVYVIVTNKRL